MRFALPGRRLVAAAELVRRGAYLADVGTDHAYLPVYLVGNGLARCAIATDINPGPLDRAVKNIAAAGLSDAISVRLTDGVCGLDGLGITDYAICGMGGELIASIIDVPFLRDPAVSLVLQPMTKPEVLRAYLVSHGFAVTDERLVREGERIYQVIAATFTGEIAQYSAAELLLGRVNILRGGELLTELAARELDHVEKRIAGRRSAGLDASAEEALAAELKTLK